MIEGVELQIGTRVFLVPALNMKRVKKIQTLLAQLSSIPLTGMLNDEQIGIITDIALEGLQRNYPDLTKEELEEELDFNNILPVIEAVIGQSGLKKSRELSTVTVAQSP